MKKTGLLLILAGLLLMSRPALATMLEVGVGVWEQNVKGDLYYNLYSQPDEADMEDDLDLEDDTRGTGYLKLDLPLFPTLYLGVTPMDFEGTGIMDDPYVFGDKTFLAGRPVNTDIILNHFDVGLYYSLTIPDFALLKKVKMDLGVNFRNADLDVEVRGTVDGEDGETLARESQNYTLVLPMLYGAMQITPVDSLSLEFEGRGVTLSSDHLVSLLGKVKYRVHGPFFVSAGYRFDSIRLDEDDLNVDCTVSGVFCETGCEF
jgi:outer membrane protein